MDDWDTVNILQQDLTTKQEDVEVKAKKNLEERARSRKQKFQEMKEK